MKRDKWYPTKYSPLCSAHFEERYMYFVNDKTRLLANALPTIFDFPHHVQKKYVGRPPSKKQTFEEAFLPMTEGSTDMENQNLDLITSIKKDHTYCISSPRKVKEMYEQMKNTNINLKRKLSCAQLKTKISKEINFSSKNCAQNHEDPPYIKNNLVKIKQFYHLKSRYAENLLENKNTNQKENDIQNEQNNQCQNNLKSTKEEFHRCNICSKEFLSLINVLVHKYRFCKARLTRINFMKRLMKLKPSIKRKYHCNLCKRNLFNESYLRTHLFMHIGKRPFSCKVCFKSFYIKSYLQNHVKIHTKENIFQKKTCERNFNFDSYLNNYEDHSEEYEFFYCHICRKNFQTEIALIIHGINHSEAKFHCDICNKNFQYKSAFVKHQASHYEDRPFSI